jgi:hypothetical protein
LKPTGNKGTKAGGS